MSFISAYLQWVKYITKEINSVLSSSKNGGKYAGRGKSFLGVNCTPVEDKEEYYRDEHGCIRRKK